MRHLNNVIGRRADILGKNLNGPDHQRAPGIRVVEGQVGISLNIPPFPSFVERQPDNTNKTLWRKEKRKQEAGPDEAYRALNS